MIVTVGLQQLAYMQALLNVIISMITLSVNLINQEVNPDGQVQLLGERVFFFKYANTTYTPFTLPTGVEPV